MHQCAIVDRPLQKAGVNVQACCGHHCLRCTYVVASPDMMMAGKNDAVGQVEDLKHQLVIDNGFLPTTSFVVVILGDAHQKSI